MTRHRSGKSFYNYLFDGHTEEKCGLTDRLSQYMIDSIENKYDCIVKVGGHVGVGKSNFAVDLALTVDPTFTLEDRYVYDLFPFLVKLQTEWDNLKPGMCFLMDEATNLVDKRNWNTDVSKAFADFQKMFRSLGLILIMVMPELDDFDKGLRETARARYTVTVHDLPNGGKYSGRGYYELDMLTLEGSPIHVGLGTFPIMDVSYLDDYEALKKGSQKTKLDELIERLRPPEPKENNRGRDKEMALWLILHDGWSYEEVSARFNIPKSTLRRWKTEYKRGE